MQRRHARYPFLEESREAVREADVDLTALVAADDPAVERGVERVERAVGEGTVGAPRRRTRVELLSYPVARVLVSLVDQAVLTRRYAQAEARTAIERLREDDEGEALRSAGGGQLSLAEALAEFDLSDAVRERADDGGYEVDATAYLPLAAERPADEWRLVNRDLADGTLPVSSEELFALLEAAVERRIAEGLPFEVPDAVAAELAAERTAVRDLLADHDPTRDIDAVVPELVPPCMRALLDAVRAGERLDHHSRFAVTAFLASTGMSTDDIVAFSGESPGFDEETIRYQAGHVGSGTAPTEYAPPSCATMQSYGDCVDADDLCETIGHPLAYYEAALDRAGDVEDWRERRADG